MGFQNSDLTFDTVNPKYNKIIGFQLSDLYFSNMEKEVLLKYFLK